MVMTRLGFGMLAAILVMVAPWAVAAETTVGPIFLRMKPISFSVIGPSNKITKEVSIVLNLELEEGKDEKMLDPYRRQIGDAFLVTLNDVFDAVPEDGQLDLVELKDKLLKVAVAITGPGYIHSVLVIGIGERVHPH